MAFAEGQQVRLKQGQQIARIAKKLSYMDDMYVVLIDGTRAQQKRIAHASDMELLTTSQESAHNC